MNSPPTERIVKTPGICGGRARIAGHRIRVQDVVVWHEHMGMSPDEIVAQYPTITLSEVHGALAYYFDHVSEIRAQMEAEQAFVEEFRRQNPSPSDEKLALEAIKEAS